MQEVVMQQGGDALGDLLDPGAQQKKWNGSPSLFAQLH
jgi:hypothetical protein